MDNGFVRRALSKRLTRWSGQSLPGWWTLFTIIVGVGFFLFLGHAFITEPDTPKTLPPLPPAAAPHITEPDAPVDESRPTAEPVTTATSKPPSAHVPGADPDAAALAQLSFRALFDPDAAAQVLTTDGGRLQPPLQKLPGAVTDMKLKSVSQAKDRFTFTARVDPDGKGPLQATHAELVIARFGGGWALVTTG